MNRKIHTIITIALCSLFTFAHLETTRAQGTAFTYQGALSNGGSAASGSYDFTFALFNNNGTNSGQVGGALTQTGVGVTNGLFTVTLDFGPVFTGGPIWLAIAVRTNGAPDFTPLSPLQNLTPAPYAMYAPSAGTAASANSVAGSNISGTIPLAQLPGAVVTNGESGVNLNFLGNVGIDTSSPVNALDVNGNGDFTGFLGIGTTAPSTPLHVYSAGTPNMLVDGSSTVGTWLSMRNTGGGTNWHIIATGSGNGEGAGKLAFNVGSAPGSVSAKLMILDSAGRLGIGTTSPGSPLDIVEVGNLETAGLRLEGSSRTHFWNMFYDNSAALIFSFDNNYRNGVGYAYLTSTSYGLISVSDRRAKKDMQPMGECLDRVMELKPTSFRYKNASEDTPPNYGFIAQEIETVFPDVVLEKNGMKTLAVNSLIAVNTKAIQDLKREKDAEIEILKAEIAGLKAKMDKLEK